MRTRRQQRRDVNGKLKSNFTINNTRKPGCEKPMHETNGVKPKEPETLSRQVVRRMLRDKAKADLMKQYGRTDRRTRHAALKLVVKRWYQQIRESGEPKKVGLLTRFLKSFAPAGNTLKASGVTA